MRVENHQATARTGSVPSSVTPARTPRNKKLSDAKSTSQGNLTDIAKSDEKWDQFVFALTGKTEDQLTPGERKKLKQLRQEILDGKIDPEFVSAGGPASGKADRLPSGVRGAFVDTGGGRVLISDRLGGKQLQRTSDEELGEAVAARADGLGIDVADGDAGARMSSVVNGETIAPTAFVSSASDETTAVSNGQLVSAQADAAANTAIDELVQLVIREGVLSEERFIAEMQARGVSGDRAKRFLYVFGSYDPKTKSWSIDSAGIANAQATGALELAPDGTLRIQFAKISPTALADGIIQFTAARTGRTVEQVEKAGVSAAELDEATDHLFGDWKPLRADGAETLTNRFGTINSGGTKSLSRNDVSQLFGSGAISINGATDTTRSDFISITVNTDAAPSLDTDEYVMSFFMGFDADGDGSLNETEFRHAIEKYYDNENANPPLTKIKLMFNFYSGGDRKVSEGELGDMLNEGSLVVRSSIHPGAPASILFDFSKIPTERATNAVWQRIADERGVAVEDLEWVSDVEFDKATDFVFGGNTVTGGVRTSIFKDFGTPDSKGKKLWLSRPSMMNILESGRLEFSSAGELTYIDGRMPNPTTADARPIGRIGTVPPDDPSQPYVLQTFDTGGAQYGSSYFQGNLKHSTGSVDIAQQASKLVRNTVYADPQALEPHHSQPGVYNPPEIHRVDLTNHAMGRVAPQRMTRTEAGDGKHVIWNIAGAERKVVKGSKLDTYLMDYHRFASPKGGNHLAGQPNVERVKSFTDEEGNTVEVWAPRQHQFRTDARGNAVPLAEEPIVTVNGKAIEPSRMFLGVSPVDGKMLVGFETQNPNYDPADPNSEPTETVFIPLETTMTAKTSRAFTALATQFNESGNLEGLDEVAIDPSDPAFDDYSEFEGERAEEFITEEEQQELGAAAGDAMDSAVSSPEGKKVVDDTTKKLEEEGVMLTGDAMVALGYAPEGEVDPNQIYLVEKTPGLQKRMTAMGMGDMDVDVLHDVPLSNKGRTLEDVGWTGSFQVRPNLTHIDDFQWESTHEGANGHPQTWRFNMRTSYATFSPGGISAPGAITVGFLTNAAPGVARSHIAASGGASLIAQIRIGLITEHGNGHATYPFLEAVVGVRASDTEGGVVWGSPFKDTTTGETSNHANTTTFEGFGNVTFRYRYYNKMSGGDFVGRLGAPAQAFYNTMSFFLGGDPANVMIGGEARLKLEGTMDNNGETSGSFGAEIVPFVIIPGSVPTTMPDWRTLATHWRPALGRLAVQGLSWLATQRMNAGRAQGQPAVGGDPAQGQPAVGRDLGQEFTQQLVIAVLNGFGPGILGATRNAATGLWNTGKMVITSISNAAGEFIGFVVERFGQNGQPQGANFVGADGAVEAANPAQIQMAEIQNDHQIEVQLDPNAPGVGAGGVVPPVHLPDDLGGDDTDSETDSNWTYKGRKSIWFLEVTKGTVKVTWGKADPSETSLLDGND